MTYLSKRYRGQLHNPDLSLDDTIAPRNVHQLAVKTEATIRKSSANSNYDAERKTDDYNAETKTDEVVELGAKSNSTVIAENYAKAKAAGQVISLTSATTSQTTSTSIRSTFDSISDSVSVMRSSTKRKEREVTVQENSAMITYMATRMVLTKDSNGEKTFTTVPGETPNSRAVQVSMHPFAQGKSTAQMSVDR